MLSIGGTYCDKLGSLRVLGVFQIVLGALSVAVHSFMLTQYHNLTVDVSLINKTQVLVFYSSIKLLKSYEEMVLSQFGITELDGTEGGSGGSNERSQRRLEYVKLFNEESDENKNVTFCLMNSLVEDNVCIDHF